MMNKRLWLSGLIITWDVLLFVAVTYGQETEIRAVATGMDEPVRRAKMAAGIFGGENRKTITGAGEARGERFKIVMVSR